MRTFWLSVGKWLLSAFLLLAGGLSHAQVAYGISRTQTYVINPNTGVATLPAVAGNYAAQQGYESSAMAVSSLKGLLYMIERVGELAAGLMGFRSHADFLKA